MKSKYKKLKDELLRIAKACAPTPEDMLVYTGRARRLASFLKDANIQISSANSIKLRHIECYFQQRYRTGVSSKILREELDTIKHVLTHCGKRNIVKNERLTYTSLNIADVRPIIICPYCGNKTNLIKGALMPFSISAATENKYYWICPPCNAWVGCHKNSGRPLGTPAKENLRILRTKVRKLFDNYQQRTNISRNGANIWLSRKLNCHIHECHIGYFDEDMCNRASEIIITEINKNTYPPDSF